MSVLILASGSKARQEMLRGAGLAFETRPADINEAEILQAYGHEGANVAAKVLAAQKALAISQQHPDKFVIGSDQILECEGVLHSKARNAEEAREKLKNLRGRTHTLTSAVAVAREGKILWEHQDHAYLTMHEFSAEFLDRYLASAGDIVTTCVGAYALEDIGVQLFEKIEGDYFTILGMPLLPLLQYLRDTHGVSL